MQEEWVLDPWYPHDGWIVETRWGFIQQSSFILKILQHIPAEMIDIIQIDRKEIKTHQKNKHEKNNTQITGLPQPVINKNQLVINLNVL